MTFFHDNSKMSAVQMQSVIHFLCSPSLTVTERSCLQMALCSHSTISHCLCRRHILRDELKILKACTYLKLSEKEGRRWLTGMLTNNWAGLEISEMYIILFTSVNVVMHRDVPQTRKYVHNFEVKIAGRLYRYSPVWNVGLPVVSLRCYEISS